MKSVKIKKKIETGTETESGVAVSVSNLCLLVVLLAVPSWAQDKSWEKQWNETLAAAKKEGSVVVAGSPDPVMRNEILPKFMARFGIRLELIAGRSSEIAARVRTERQAGVHSVDIFMAGPDTTANVLYAEKMIDPLRPMLLLPDVVDPSKWKRAKPWFIDPEERYVLRPFSSVASLFFINTDHVRPGEMRFSKDLLNFKWRGKISTDDPTVIGEGANKASRFYLLLGEDFVRKLYLEQKPVRTRDRRLQADWLARGTYPICLNCRQDDVRPLAKEGFKLLEIFELSDLPGTINSSPWLLTVANQAPHPNAARVFANWIVSREGLEIYSRGYGNATLRTDIDESFLEPVNIPKPGVNYFDDSAWSWIVTGRKESREKVWKVLKSR